MENSSKHSPPMISPTSRIDWWQTSMKRVRHAIRNAHFLTEAGRGCHVLEVTPRNTIMNFGYDQELSGQVGVALGPQRPHDYLYWEFHELNGRVAIRRGNWKAVRYGVAIDPNSPLELYDLSKDPGEKSNIAAQSPEIVRELDGLLKQARTVSPIEKFNFPKNPSVKQTER